MPFARRPLFVNIGSSMDQDQRVRPVPYESDRHTLFIERALPYGRNKLELVGERMHL